MMTVFDANCVAIVLVIYLSVVLATCVHLACHCIVVPYKTQWLVHRYIGVPIGQQFCCYLVGFAVLSER